MHLLGIILVCGCIHLVGTQLHGTKEKRGIKKWISKISKKTDEEEVLQTGNPYETGTQLHGTKEKRGIKKWLSKISKKTDEEEVLQTANPYETGTQLHGTKEKRGIKKWLSKISKKTDEEEVLQTANPYETDPRVRLYKEFLNSSYVNISLEDINMDNGTQTQEPKVIRGKGLFDLLKPRTTIDPNERRFQAYLKHLDDDMKATKGVNNSAYIPNELDVIDITCTIKPSNQFGENHADYLISEVSHEREYKSEDVPTYMNQQNQYQYVAKPNLVNHQKKYKTRNKHVGHHKKYKNKDEPTHAEHEMYQNEDGDKKWYYKEEVSSTSEVNKVQERTEQEEEVIGDAYRCCGRSSNMFPENDIRYILPQEVVVP